MVSLAFKALFVGSALMVGACSMGQGVPVGGPRSRLEGVRVGMTKAAFEALKLPLGPAWFNGPRNRYSETYEIRGGGLLSTTWNYERKPPRLVWFRVLPKSKKRPASPPGPR